MFTIQGYVVPETIEEAYKVLNDKKSNKILGGTAFLKMSSVRIGTAIDLSKLDLNYIREDENYIDIGAMTTFRELETSSIINNYCSGIISKSVSSIIGVQFRNVVTVGATIYSRYGFSDLITALLALNTEVVLYKAGRMSLEQYLEKGSPKDILIKILLRKEQRKAAFHSIRNSAVDYAILNVAVSKKDSDWKIAVGARPMRATLAHKAALFLGQNSLEKTDIENAAAMAADELSFGSNMRGSNQYRQALCQVLVKRAVMEVLS